MRKSAPTQVQWTLTCDQAFGKLKEFLCSKLVLNTPDFNRPFILQTDASNRGVQAVLTQIDDNSKEHPIAYYSRKLLSRKERYSVVEKECLAIRLKSPGIQSMPAWTWFTITTACCCLERLEYNNTHLTVGVCTTQPYRFTVQHRPGVGNGNVEQCGRLNLLQFILLVRCWFMLIRC